MSEAENTAAKKREPKKNSIPQDEVKALVEGMPQYTKASFLVVGHKNGVRLAIPLTSGVSRVYFYGNDNYGLIPDDEAITVYDEAQRKERHRGGIMAEIDFGKGVEAARRALGKLVDVVKTAPVPEAKPAKVKKAGKAEPEAETSEPEPSEESDSAEG